MLHAFLLLVWVLVSVGCGSAKPPHSDQQLATVPSSFVPEAPIPIATRGHASVTYGGKIYIFGGATAGDDYRNVFMYDPDTRAWSTLAPMPVSMIMLTAHVVGDMIYVFAGYDWTGQPPLGFTSVVLAFDPVANVWSRRATRPHVNYTFMSAMVGDRVFVIGGQGPMPGNTTTWPVESYVDIYDPGTDSWSTGAPLPIALDAGAACAINQKIYVFGATDVTDRATFVYDTLMDSWSTGAADPMDRPEAMSCVSVGEDIDLIGGRTTDPTQPHRISVYTPDSDSWRDLGVEVSPRYWFSASLLDGSIFIVGGAVAADGTMTDDVESLQVESLSF